MLTMLTSQILIALMILYVTINHENFNPMQEMIACPTFNTSTHLDMDATKLSDGHRKPTGPMIKLIQKVKKKKKKKKILGIFNICYF